MGLSLGSGKSSNNSTSNTNQTQTYTPTNPSWVAPQIAGLAGQITGLAGQNPQSFFAGADPLQTQAAGGASRLATSPNYGLASGALSGLSSAGGLGYNPAGIAESKMPTMDAANIASLIPQFMNPYTNDVVNSSLADYDTGAGQTRAQNQLALAGDDTFSGSGGAIQTALSNDAITRGRASLAAGLRDQGFQTALGGATNQAGFNQQANQINTQNAFQRLTQNQNANNAAWSQNAQEANAAQDRQLQAANSLANVGSLQDASAINNATTQSNIGSILQQISQNQAGAPLSVLQSLVNSYGGLPLDLLHGQIGNLVGTTNTSGSGSQFSAGLGGS